MLGAVGCVVVRLRDKCRGWWNGWERSSGSRDCGLRSVVVTDPGHPQQAIAPLLQGAFGAQTAQILYVAAKPGIADLLRDGHRTAPELARAIGADAVALQRVLRGLV